MPSLETRIVLCNKVGLHARPAALLRQQRNLNLQLG
ncbi:MAG: HPr family phosphocarrier protein [Candidatus Baldrarchaeia archaeon]